MLQKELAKRLKARYDTKMDGNGWLEEKPMTYINEKHRARFTHAAKNISKTNYALLSALYLLTADKRLWGCCKHHNHWLNARTGGFYGVSSHPRYRRRCRMAVFLHSPMAGHRILASF